MKFSALNADISSPSANHLGLRTPVQVGVNKFLNGVDIDDIEWPWTTKISGFSVLFNFRLRRTFQEWIAPKWLEIDLDNLAIKFLA